MDPTVEKNKVFKNTTTILLITILNNLIYFTTECLSHFALNLNKTNFAVYVIHFL